MRLVSAVGVDSYVEPFGGTADVLSNRHPSGLETFNDPDDNVVTLFRVLRESSDMEAAAMELAKAPAPELKGDMRRAAWFYRASSVREGGGRMGVMDMIDRLRKVQIEWIPPARCVRDFDSPRTLFHVVLRSGRTPARDRLLARLLGSVKGKVVLRSAKGSVDGSLYGDWDRHELPDGSLALTNFRVQKTFFA